VRGVGYHESVAGVLDHARIDLLPGAAVRIQHRSGARWMLSSEAVRRLGPDDGVDAPGVDETRAGGRPRGGVALGAGTDAPFGDPDPWLAIPHRRRRGAGPGRPKTTRQRSAPLRGELLSDDAGGCTRLVS
jgi:hypothetical protein